MNTLMRLRLPALVVAVLAAVPCIAAWFMNVERTLFFRAYLFGYLFCLGLALGSLALVMLHNLTGGEWGVRVRPMARAGAMTLPLLAVLFVPVCLGMQWLYPWARAAEVSANATLLHRHVYLNGPFFLVRAALYFVIWIALAFLMQRPRPATRALSAAGLILYLFTMTHAGIDWIMSRDTEFYSTAFGFVITVGQTLSAMAFAVALVPQMREIPAKIVAPRPAMAALLNDLGNLLLTLVILWAYVSFMQLLVIWMGNTHEDNAWYLERGLGGGGDSLAWRIVGLALVLFQFFVPFYLLLFRRVKQNSRVLTATAYLLLAAHVLEVYWLVAPSDHGEAAVFDPYWLDGAAFIALFGLWLAVFLFLLPRAAEPAGPVIPVEGALAHE